MRDAGGAFLPYTLERVFFLWLRGCFLWVPPSKVGEAIFYWEESLERLNEVRGRQGFSDETKQKWVDSRISEMEEAIKKAARKEQPPLPSEVRTNASSDKQASSEFFASIPALGEIPAGYPTGVFPEADLSLKFRGVFLDDMRYEAFSLTDKSIVEIKNLKNYYVLRVNGDSMNQSVPVKILNGNYMLLKKQNFAQNRDIVAVGIVGSADRATLKRYIFEEGRHILEPESDHPDFQAPIDVEQEIGDWDEKVIVWGVAVAVLKKALG